MINTEYVLLGKWIFELVLKYLKTQKKSNSDKLFIKISGLDDNAWQPILKRFQDFEEELSKYYQPIIRTIKEVEGFNNYRCKAHETSTWLRNNTASGEVLIIFMNEESAEAQSLENIFTIDEIRLLSSDGMQTLYQILSDSYKYVGDEIDAIEKFMNMYNKIVEPQLRHVLAFISSIINDNQSDMIEKIQNNMDKLMLFRDSKLTIRKTDIRRLKNNVSLSRLERDGRSLDKSKLIENLNAFVDRTESDQYPHELWEQVERDKFRKQAIAFINRESNELLEYDFDIISEVFFFKVKKPKIGDLLKDFKEGYLETLEDWNEEKEQLVLETIEAVHGHNPDVIDDFIEEFSNELQDYDLDLKKHLVRILNKQRKLAEYNELSYALLEESIQLLEEFYYENDSVEEIGEVLTPHFKLSLNSLVPDGKEEVYKFHLLNINLLTKYISFDEQSLKTSESKSKDDEVSFNLKLLIGGKIVKETNFKLIGGFTGVLVDFINQFKEEGYIPYVRSYVGDQIKSINIVKEMNEEVKRHSVIGNTTVSEAADKFYQFINWYTEIIDESLSSGLCTVDFIDLENKLEVLLSQIHKSANITKLVFHPICRLGVLDLFNCKIEDPVGHPEKRTLTLLNPLRLLSYSKRLSHIGACIEEWIAQFGNMSASIIDTDAFISQKVDEVSQLSPRYFVIEGVSDLFLIEKGEIMGEGEFSLNGANIGDTQLIETFSTEILDSVKAYLDVYPYSSDCLDLVFLYCPHANYVINAIEKIFNHTNVQKVKVVVHSERNGAEIHGQLNSWIEQNEFLSERYNSFPKVEVQVIAKKNVNQMIKNISDALIDADIGILIDYFNEDPHIAHKLEKVNIQGTDNWFCPVYKEPYKKEDSLKRVNFVGEKLPRVLQYFYQMQAIVHNGEIINPEDHYILRNIISISRQQDSQLINFMLKECNWSLFIDRHLDKTLLEHVSSKAQIIKYKTDAGKNKNFRTILTSSRYIHKLVKDMKDHDYYDRLYHKTAKIMKNDHIDMQVIIKAIECVKEISGGIVLRAIGPGKFMHELLAIYLTTLAYQNNDNELVVWSTCDELPWFQGSKRKPDLVRTLIRVEDNKIYINFEVMELKFVSHTIFEKERLDGLKQVKVGLDIYKERFIFNENSSIANIWRKELVDYLLEHRRYNAAEAQLLKELQTIPAGSIDVELSGSIHTYVYTSNLHDHTIMDGSLNGYQKDILEEGIINHIYTRTYILDKLGVSHEPSTPTYDITMEFEDYVTKKLGLTRHEDLSINLSEEISGKSDQGAETVITHVTTKPQKEIAATLESNKNGTKQLDERYPEEIALANVPREYKADLEDIKPLVDVYQRKLRINFNQIGIPIKIVETHIGVSVIRIVIEIPIDKSYSSIANKAKDIFLWLKLPTIPMISLRQGRINIDINREKPEFVYFDEFMKLVRSQFPPEKLKGRLVAPIGIGQLRELISIDFSNSNTPHLLIGGTTGSGKSVTINSIVIAMMCLYSPNEVQFVFIDPKKVEFKIFENRVNTRQVVTDIEEAIIVLEKLVEEMEARYDMFSQESVLSIDEYVEVTGRSLPRIVVVFDEFADFMEREKDLRDRVENSILRLGAKARAAGIHLIICTQNPKADIIPTNIRNNLPARLALKTSDHYASKIIINEEGAENLGGKGDFLAKLDTADIIRAKSPFLTTNIRRALLNYFTNNINKGANSDREDELDI